MQSKREEGDENKLASHDTLPLKVGSGAQHSILAQRACLSACLAVFVCACRSQWKNDLQPRTRHRAKWETSALI